MTIISGILWALLGFFIGYCLDFYFTKVLVKKYELLNNIFGFGLMLLEIYFIAIPIIKEIH